LVKRRIKHLFAIKNLLEAPKSSATIWLIVAQSLTILYNPMLKLTSDYKSSFWLI
jgi:hypothetical protein